jgi:Bax protein
LLRRDGAAAGPLLVVALWAACTGITGQRGPGAEALPAFHQVEPTSIRKERFFTYLTPVVRAENDRIHQQRSRLLGITAAWKAGEAASWRETRFLVRLAREYQLKADALPLANLIDELLNRVDVIPRSLVLAQAAKESAWGLSRFARRGNNLFGQWCFEPGCGMVPRRRPTGMSHEVRSFETVRDSVSSYIRNLNTHRSYRDLRRLRAQLRRRALPLSGMLLAEGLRRYSERGDRYVREVQSLIRQNGLESASFRTAVTGS